MSSFIYPRTITITRPVPQSGVGAVGYGGLQPSNETTVATGLPASIQFDRTGTSPRASLPGDSIGNGMWRVFIPGASAQNGLINSQDVITDDLGVRYQVSAPYWNSLGYALRVEKLET